MRLFYPSFFLLATPNLHRADFSSASGHGAPSLAPPAPGTEKPSQQTDSNPTTASSPAALPPPRQALRPRALPHPAPLRAALSHHAPALDSAHRAVQSAVSRPQTRRFLPPCRNIPPRKPRPSLPVKVPADTGSAHELYCAGLEA